MAKGVALTDNVATTIATVSIGGSGMAGGTIHAVIQVTNGTDRQILSQVIEWAMVTKTAVFTTNITATTGAKAVSGGTLTATWTITSAGVIQVTADTSLTPSGVNSFVCYFSIENHSEYSVTI